MTGVNDFADKRIEAERKMIAEWLDGEFARRFPVETKFVTVHVALNQASEAILRGEYRKGAGE